MARRLAPLRLAAGVQVGRTRRWPPSMGLAELLGIGDPETFSVRAGLAAPAQPRPAAGADRRRARTAAPIELDLKESAQDGMGPHGLLIGATGSGKSELLRTLVLGAGRHPLLRDAELRAGRLQGRRDLRLAGPAAAHRRGDHQPGRRAAAGRPHGRRDRRRADPPPGAAAHGRQLRQRCATTRRPGPAGAAARRRCRRCWSSATSSPSCWPPSPTSSTCSSRSDGWAGRSACTCCWPASGWRRAGCAGWTPTCRTGSGCGRSRRWSRGRCSACRTRTSCPARPGHGYLKFGTEPLVRFKAAYVSGPYRGPAAAAPVPAGDGAAPQVLAYSTHYVPAPEPAAPVEPAARGRRRPARACWTCMVDRLGGPGPAGAPGLAAAADRAAGASTSCSARSPSTRYAAWPSPTRSCTARCRCRSRSSTSRCEQRRDVLWLRAGRRGRARRGRRRRRRAASRPRCAR